jgi:hypothetical protein
MRPSASFLSVPLACFVCLVLSGCSLRLDCPSRARRGAGHSRQGPGRPTADYRSPCLSLRREYYGVCRPWHYGLDHEQVALAADHRIDRLCRHLCHHRPEWQLHHHRRLQLHTEHAGIYIRAGRKSRSYGGHQQHSLGAAGSAGELSQRRQLPLYDAVRFCG